LTYAHENRACSFFYVPRVGKFFSFHLIVKSPIESNWVCKGTEKYILFK
jgi:hypothetical protein